ncbi:MAG: hypothetical protein A2X94_01220 [Bdellovibrionales bacterium GWB1_55_8]|nr:MAG: hypothetical protein A2X94_01220 [Bdellovibrionales bacterium GWB1_55_8]
MKSFPQGSHRTLGWILASALLATWIPAQTLADTKAVKEIRENYREREVDLRDKEKEVKAIDARIKEEETLVKKLQKRNFDPGEEFDGPCSCRPGTGVGAGPLCKDKDFADVGIDPATIDEIPGELCEALYVRDKKFQKLSATCQPAVRQCGSVALKLAIIAANDRKKELLEEKKGLVAERDRMKQDLADIKGDCPECFDPRALAMMPREPGFGDYLIGTLQALTPYAAMGFGAYNQSKMVNAYSDSYSGYLNQCATIGVPCMPPGGAGGGGFGGGFGGGGFGGGYYGGGSPYGGSFAGNFAGNLLGGLLGGGGGIYVGGNMGGSPWGSPWGMPGGGVSIGGNMGNPWGGGLGNPWGTGGSMVSGFGMPTFPYGTGYSTGGALFPYGPYGPGAGGAGAGIQIGWGPGGGGGGGYWPGGGGGGGGYWPGGGGGAGGYWPGGGGGAGGWNLAGNSQYQMLLQSSMQSQMLQAERARQAQGDYMISQQQVYEAEQRRYQAMMQTQSFGGGYGYGSIGAFGGSFNAGFGYGGGGSSF